MPFDANSTVVEKPVCLSHLAYSAETPPISVPISPCGSDERTTAVAKMDERVSVSSLKIRADAPLAAADFRNIECDYHIEPRVLGAGHQGSVRACEDRATGRRRAVKSVRKGDPTLGPGGPAREVGLLQEMHHHGIVRLVDCYEDARYVHIVTDLCEGGELFDKINEKTAHRGNGPPCFAENEAARLVHQMLAAVSYMHDRGIVHRDLKPENILYKSTDEDSSIEIIDFGLACKHPGHSRNHMRAKVGTSYYVAPEVLRGQYDKLCDVWSVGVIAYILLCGFPPFNGSTDQEVHELIRRSHCHFSTIEWLGVSREGRSFVRRLLQKDPRKRMTVDQALHHPWMLKHVNRNVMASGATNSLSSRLDKGIVNLVAR